MADLRNISLLEGYDGVPPDMKEAIHEFVRITGISHLAIEEVGMFGGVRPYTDLLGDLSTLLPDNIALTGINGFTRCDIANKRRVNTRLHVHFNVNATPYCIYLDGDRGSFQFEFLIRLNNILCNFAQPERFLNVYCGGLNYIDEQIHIAYITPNMHTDLQNHELRFAIENDGGVTGQFDENYSVSACQLPVSEQTNTIIRANN